MRSMEPASSAPGARLRFIDVLRGLVVCIMALDHARDMFHFSGYAYDPLDPAHTTPIVYFTRWITHLCAPTFVFLAGASAWLQLSRGKSLAQLSRFLLIRGFWLILLEVTFISFGWAFTVPYLVYFQVMWAMGWAMIALAGLIWLPRKAIACIAAIIIAGHNLTDHISPHAFGALSKIWSVLHNGGAWPSEGTPVLLMTYPLLVWPAVMAAGFCMGPVFISPRRNRLIPAIGGLLLGFFFVLRLLNFYGDPHRWMHGATASQTVMSFLNVQKYPPSLLYLSVTLGLAFLLAFWLDRWRGRLTDILRVFGSVPLFVYILHIYLLHAADLGLLLLTHRPTSGSFDQGRMAFFSPEKLAGSGFSLPVVYAVWLGALCLLYPLCRWYASVKASRRYEWLSYL